MPDGITIDAYHAALLTLLVAAWLLWIAAGAWAERRGELPARLVVGAAGGCIAGALAAGQPFAALYLVQWLLAAWLGVRGQRLVSELRRGT